MKIFEIVKQYLTFFVGAACLCPLINYYLNVRETKLIGVQSNRPDYISPWSRVHYGLVRNTEKLTGSIDNKIEKRIHILKNSIEQILSPAGNNSKSSDFGGLNPPVHATNLPRHPASPLCAVPVVADIEAALQPGTSAGCSEGGMGEAGTAEWHRPLMPISDAAEQERRAARRRRLERAALRRLAAHAISSAEQKMGRYPHGGLRNVAKASCEC